MRGVCAISSDMRLRARHASRALRRARGGSGRSESLYGSASFWVGLGWGSGWDCARGLFSTERVLHPDPLNYYNRTPLINH